MDEIRLFTDQNAFTSGVMVLVFILLCFLCFTNNRRDIKADPFRMITMTVIFFGISLWFIFSTPKSFLTYSGLSTVGVVVAVGFSVLYLFVCSMMNDRETIRTLTYRDYE